MITIGTGDNDVSTKLSNLDLNLLMPLDALLRERSVSRAAARLGKSQPTLSTALSRLRRQFRDDLLVRSRTGYELTPFALQLRARLEIAVPALQRLYTSEPTFDPATSKQTFHLVGSDYMMALLGKPLARLLAERAPGVRLYLELHHPQAFLDAPNEKLRAIDGIVWPHGYLNDVPFTDLFTDQWCCLVDVDHPKAVDGLTMEDVTTMGWVLNYPGPAAHHPAARALQMLGVEPRVHAVVESILAVPHLISGTELVALVPSAVGELLASQASVRALPCPWDPSPLIMAFWWDPLRQRDPEHMWLRAALTEAAASLRP